MGEFGVGGHVCWIYPCYEVSITVCLMHYYSYHCWIIITGASICKQRFTIEAGGDEDLTTLYTVSPVGQLRDLF